ncbi:MAG TPA: GntR family transcriptional regulator [Steroidobacteraceae bacterium]
MLPGRVQIAINLVDGVPIYRQIVTQIHYQVASGVLEPDAALPSIRAMALELNVAPNTIAKAYEELEGAGVVHKRRGFGTFVSFEQADKVDRERHRIVEQRIDALLAEARQLNFSAAAVLALIQRRDTRSGPDQPTVTAGE